MFRLLPTLFATLALSLLASCNSDIVKLEYASYHLANSENVFARGWLPPIIPPESTNIYIESDVDSNSASGHFQASKSSILIFRMQLKKESDKEYSYSKEKSKWMFSFGSEQVLFTHRLIEGT